MKTVQVWLSVCVCKSLICYLYARNMETIPFVCFITNGRYLEYVTWEVTEFFFAAISVCFLSLLESWSDHNASIGSCLALKQCCVSSDWKTSPFSKLVSHVECPLNFQSARTFSVSLIAICPEPRTKPSMWKVLSKYLWNKQKYIGIFSFLRWRSHLPLGAGILQSYPLHRVHRPWWAFEC